MFPSPTVTPQHSLVCAAVLFCLSACAPATDSPTISSASEALCASNGVEIRTDFAGAGQHKCAARPDEFVLTVQPEPSLYGRINPSPWYAFEVAGAADQTVDIVLDYGSYEHRYSPWIRMDGGLWQEVAEDKLELSEKGHKARLTLDISSDDYVIAGLPVVTSEMMNDWTRGIAETHGLETRIYGQSMEGRELTALLVGNPDADRLVVALTRQHPPELAGAIAFKGFVSEVLNSDQPELLETTRFLFFPLMNPDGVDGGYWRHNSGAVDMNRDWFDATQPEVASAQKLILAEAEGRSVEAFLDFHSTWRTLVYFHPFDTPGADSSFPEALTAAMDAEFTPQPDWISSHNDGRGTSKNWALQTFNTPGMTIELGDEASQSESERVGKLTAEVLRETLTSP